MHRRSPCRYTFCSQRSRPRSRHRPAGRRGRRSGDYRRAKKPPRPGKGDAAVCTRRAGAAAGPAGGVTAA
ncbi:hypothetical protein GD429_38085 [Burkholderia sp. BE17]|nr:hypothetical protein [Burkholderia sp. BE17]